MHSGSVLLINPWIYDFAAYDLWTEPLGLLYIASLLRENGYQINLVNCLDRHHPDLLRLQNRKTPKNDRFGCGKFHKEIVEKPALLEDIPRRYGRYGLPFYIFRKELAEVPKPDVILVTSGMTYWYPGVFAVIREVREHFPSVPVILGGIYATLCCDHAVQKSGADYVVKGEGEIQTLNLVDQLLDRVHRNLSLPQNIDDYPYPAHDLLTDKDSLAILTSRGCPMGCTYCASKLVAGPFRQRDPVRVADEIEFYRREFGTGDFVFFDDALLLNPEGHISVILEEVIRRKLDCCFHTPNGMHASQISEPLARQMFRAGFKTIRIGLETSNEARQRSTGDKITPGEFREAIDNLKTAGYTGRDIGVYVLIGLPGQPLEEMFESVRYVYNCGAMTKLAVYSPIPGTEEWKRAVEEFGLDPDADPLLHNNSIYPIRSHGTTIQDFQQVKAFALSCNNALSSP
jgi:radical SAM superfamily enzyme YgiQ (UPF0313 family)